MPGGLKGLTMSRHQVAIWVVSYLICAYATYAIESMYSADEEMKEEKHKEDVEKTRLLLRDDRNCVYEELSGCDTVSYSFAHGKAMALKVLKSADHSGLYTVFGEQSANHQHLLETGRKYICSIYGVATGNSMASARYALYTKGTTGKVVCVKSLPLADANLSYHIPRWKAADQQTPGSVPNPSIAKEPAARPALMDVNNCQCNAVEKVRSSHACSCHSEGLSCAPYCFCCVGEAMCFNPFTKHDENEARFDDEDEGDSTEEWGARQNGD